MSKVYDLAFLFYKPFCEKLCEVVKSEDCLYLESCSYTYL